MESYSIYEIINNSGFQIAAALISFSCMYFTTQRFYHGKLHNKLFLALLLNLMVSSVCAVCNDIVAPLLPSFPASRVVNEVSHYIYFVLHALLAPLFCIYITSVTSSFYRLNPKKRPAYEIPVYIAEFLALTNPLTHWVYHFDENHNFIRGWAEYVLYVIAASYFLICIILVLVLWRAIDTRRKKTISFFFIVITGGVLIQLLFKEIQIELFAESLALTGIMITMENEDGRRDSRTNIYNIQALLTDVNTLIAAKHPFSLICIKMINPQNLMQIIGQSNIESLTRMTADYFATLVPPYEIYYTNPGTFIILGDNIDDNRLETARKIKERFQQPWYFQERDNMFNAAIFYAEVPKDFKTMTAIMSLLNAPVNAGPRKKNDIYSGSDLNYFLRRTQVENAILNGLHNHSFLVYYQPIYDAKDMSIKSGEALLRLHDAELGDIYPDEFLPVAERGGMIFELGDFVLDEVCKFLNSGIPVEMGIDTLSINLSVVQCIQPRYAERIIQQVSRYDIEPRRISFEITESAATTDFAGLSAFVGTLRGHGFRFSVDDYGIGYSNVHSIFSLDVDLIKIDRTILWEAEQSETGRIIMECSVDMIRRMGKQILISGVESKAQIDLANEFGVNYLQGFFFSNPVSQSEFIGILKATQLARMEEQRVLAANAAMTSFLANMSHEIRTPINAVLGMDEMIIRESGDDKILEYAESIKGAGRTLLSLINDILDFSKIEAGNMDIIENEYDLTTALRDVVNMIQVKADQKNLKLIVDVEPTTPVTLYGDEMRLRQIMLNILNNAVKYTKIGAVTLKLTYEKTGKNTLNLIISVRDTGVGIREEDLGKLFKKFQRLDQTHNNTIEGSGLGLAITHELLDLMNGRIDVESTYGEGSVFTITLPQKIISGEQMGDFRKKLSKANEETPKYHESFRAPDARILVVDDTNLNLVVVKELLKQTQVIVETASSGAECLEMITKKKYDAIFLDYRMPEMDGVETLKHFPDVKDNLNTGTPVIALTANAISGARERFIKDGFNDYITKPIDAVKLEDLLLMYLPNEKIQSIHLGEQPSEPLPSKTDDLLDIEQGIKNCGSRESFNAVFLAFQGDIKDRAQTLRDAYAAKDWNRYNIDVHAIKSSARIIGANRLSKLAESLEYASEAGEMEDRQEDHELLLKLYEQFADTDSPESADNAAHTGFSKAADDALQTKSEITDSMWWDACETIREFTLVMDMDNALLVLNSLQNYNLSDDRREKVAQMQKLVSQLKWEELTSVLDNIFQSKEN